MKRIAFAAAAAALLGTGCISSTTTTTPPCSTTITLQWDFQLFDGSAPTGCGTAGVNWVDVYVDGYFIESFACGANLGTVAVSAGTHDVLVEGIDAANRIAYRDRVTVPANTCGDHFVNVRPAEGTANLNYFLSTYGLPTTCNSSPCYLWFSVWDTVADAAAAAVYSGSATAVKDDYPYPTDVVIRLPVGSFSLDWMELMSSSYAGLLLTCGPTTFDVGSALVTDVPANLSCLP